MLCSTQYKDIYNNVEKPQDTGDYNKTLSVTRQTRAENLGDKGMTKKDGLEQPMQYLH